MSVRLLLAACLVGCSASTTASTPGGDAGTTANVTVVPATCESPGACGGDPRGTWNIVSGCTISSCAGASGTVSGEYIIGDGGYTFQQDRSLTACGRRLGHGGSISAGCTISGSRIVFASGGGVDFCVQGDTLFIIDTNASFPELAVVKLTRAVEPTDAGP